MATVFIVLFILFSSDNRPYYHIIFIGFALFAVILSPDNHMKFCSEIIKFLLIV